MDKRNPIDETILFSWNETLLKIFHNQIPKYYEWTSNEHIVNVLKTLATSNIDRATHITYFPFGGDFHLRGANISRENNCIEIFFDRPFIVKPKCLTFASYGEDNDISFFFLETDELSPTLSNSNQFSNFPESLVEIAPLKYLSEDEYDDSDSYFEDNSRILYDEPRFIYRNHKGGSLVTFRIRSFYEKVMRVHLLQFPITALPIHSSMSSNQFASFMENMINKGK